MKRYFVFSVKDIVEMGMLIAVAVILDLPVFKIRIGSNGGAISLAMFPLFVLCLRQGPFKGIISCGLIFGVITCAIDGWGFATFLLDYLAGFGVIGLFGFVRPFIDFTTKKYTIKNVVFLVLGILISVAGRLLASTLSGIIFYEYNFLASLAYNAAYVLPSGGIAMCLFILLYRPLMTIEQKFPLL